MSAPVPAPSPAWTWERSLKWASDHFNLLAVFVAAAACLVLPNLPGGEWKNRYEALQRDHTELKQKLEIREATLHKSHEDFRELVNGCLGSGQPKKNQAALVR